MSKDNQLMYTIKERIRFHKEIENLFNTSVESKHEHKLIRIELEEILNSVV